MAQDKSIHRINLEHDVEKAREERRGTRRYRRSEQAKAEEFIAEAVEEIKEGPEASASTATPPTTPSEAPKSTRKPRTYDFTVDQLREAREGGSGRSWADVAKMVGLPNPGAARKAWADLTGRPHTEARQLVTRAPKGSSSSTRLDAPKWTDDTDRQAIVDRIVGSAIVIKAGLYGGTGTETLQVARVLKFDDRDPARPAVDLLEGVYHINEKTGARELSGTGARRTIFLDRIVEVR